MRKKTILLIGIMLYGNSIAQVGINTSTPDSSANLHVNSSSVIRGTLLNPVTTIQRNSISSPATGLIVYDTDLKCLMTNNGNPSAPNWQCIGENSGNNAVSYSKHFHYAFPDTIPTSTSDNSARSGTLSSSLTTMSNWLQANDPSQVAEIPNVDGIGLDIVFYNTSTTGGAVVYRPLIVNTNTTSKNLVGVTRADVSGLYQWPIPNILPGNKGYLNIDSDLILGWGSQGYLETSVSTFRITGDDGALYRVTFYGYRNYVNSSSPGKHQIHLIMEKFAAQQGGIHN
ncbi:hypothetical protein [Chryseobacterium indologenes]|uniref:Uncharacterized protein n=2 Tax=Chryseobacterium indologenes TaxID=253 RepID=A0AAD0YQT8_CHRID|nr:hypothetical protein [Chryseobacterium indologenes]AZB17179.1 hypothetical protein EG352_05045 [Chryseobacterium indologenes]MBF6644162.1 hypothetical protein [Chryseobacterium indologenes]MBU3050553.1 hypothetical protein [Chryseobacterium indologenes]MEB4763134.1 hypothetical protein [Chryseobacterium indologenes]QQQ72122.1 hypothetical protein JHW31_05180 [Chryseobacterium indologenes]